MSGQYWYDSFELYKIIKQGPGGILLILFLVYLSICIIRYLKNTYFEEVNIEENIGEYQDVLNEDDWKYTIAEEMNFRKFGVKSMLENPFELIQNKDKR